LASLAAPCKGQDTALKQKRTMTQNTESISGVIGKEDEYSVMFESDHRISSKLCCLEFIKSKKKRKPTICICIKGLAKKRNHLSPEMGSKFES